MNVEPVTLEGANVRLEPLALAHVAGLSAVGLDPELWRWIPHAVRSRDDMAEYVKRALDEQRRGLAVPFAIVERRGANPIGSTRYANISPRDRRLEIGWSWLAPAHQRTAANTEAKLLLLAHAFDALGAIRVEFKTDALNAVSRRAIARLGAVEEGTLRKHVLTWSGRARDTVYYSILEDEWPAIRTRLTERLARGS